MRERERKLNKRRDRLKSLCFLFPSLLGVGVFFVLPFGVVIYYALIDNPISARFVFADNFTRLLQNAAFRLAARNTLSFSLLAVPLAVTLSLLLALLLESRIPMKSQFRTFFLSPMMVPVASVVLIWQVLFSYNGSVNELTLALSGERIDWLQSNYAQIVVALLFLWKNLGYFMILFMAGLANIPRELIEAASVEGASDRYIFFAIKLRYLSPTLLFVTILSLINSFKIFREVFLLAGAYPHDTLYTLQHFMNNCFNALDFQKLSAAAVMMGAVMAVIIALLFWAEDRFGKDVEG